MFWDAMLVYYRYLVGEWIRKCYGTKKNYYKLEDSVDMDVDGCHSDELMIQILLLHWEREMWLFKLSLGDQDYSYRNKLTSGWSRLIKSIGKHISDLLGKVGWSRLFL